MSAKRVFLRWMVWAIALGGTFGICAVATASPPLPPEVHLITSVTQSAHTVGSEVWTDFVYYCSNGYNGVPNVGDIGDLHVDLGNWNEGYVVITPPENWSNDAHYQGGAYGCSTNSMYWTYGGTGPMGWTISIKTPYVTSPGVFQWTDPSHTNIIGQQSGVDIPTPTPEPATLSLLALGGLLVLRRHKGK
jgi:hypothetical protein